MIYWTIVVFHTRRVPWMLTEHCYPCVPLNVDWIYEWMATCSTFDPEIIWLHFWESAWHKYMRWGKQLFIFRGQFVSNHFLSRIPFYLFFKECHKKSKPSFSHLGEVVGKASGTSHEGISLPRIHLSSNGACFNNSIEQNTTGNINKERCVLDWS